MITKTKDMKLTLSELRVKVQGGLTKDQFKELRDELESNWTDELRPYLNVLMRGCINQHQCTLVSL